MYKYLFCLFFLVGCVSRPAPNSDSYGDLCATIYDPHLCLIEIDDTVFGGHGTNRCLALKNLRKNLIEKNHNPLIAEKAACGRVFN